MNRTVVSDIPCMTAGGHEQCDRSSARRRGGPFGIVSTSMIVVGSGGPAACRFAMNRPTRPHAGALRDAFPGRRQPLMAAGWGSGPCLLADLCHAGGTPSRPGRILGQPYPPPQHPVLSSLADAWAGGDLYSWLLNSSWLTEFRAASPRRWPSWPAIREPDALAGGALRLCRHGSPLLVLPPIVLVVPLFEL